MPRQAIIRLFSRISDLEKWIKSSLEALFQELGKRYAKPATLYLLGGGALMLLGSSRNTLDVDYVGKDIPGLWTDLQRTIAEPALGMEIKIEAVPYDEMIPPRARFPLESMETFKLS